MKTTKHIIIEKENGKLTNVTDYEKRPLRFSMIYDDNGEFLKRLEITITLMGKLFGIGIMVGGLVMLPFLFYLVIKTIMFLATVV